MHNILSIYLFKKKQNCINSKIVFLRRQRLGCDYKLQQDYGWS